jgi:hypothetical protein
MGKHRRFLSLGMAAIACAVGLLVGRSEAQPRQGQQAGAPLLIKIGKHFINPNNIFQVNSYNSDRDPAKPDEYLQLSTSGANGDAIYYQFGTDGGAEALLEWLDAHSVELKPKPTRKK